MRENVTTNAGITAWTGTTLISIRHLGQARVDIAGHTPCERAHTDEGELMTRTRAYDLARKYR